MFRLNGQSIANMVAARSDANLFVNVVVAVAFVVAVVAAAVLAVVAVVVGVAVVLVFGTCTVGS